MYLDYDKYVEMGGELDYSAFLNYARRAESMINAQAAGLTGVRLAKFSQPPECVAECVYDIISYLSNNADFTSVIASESQSSGGVSESISYKTLSDSEIRLAADDMIYNAFYGGGIGYLLFRGLMTDD